MGSNASLFLITKKRTFSFLKRKPKSLLHTILRAFEIENQNQ